jgi:mono/diheme cytochrome c family protein
MTFLRVLLSLFVLIILFGVGLALYASRSAIEPVPPAKATDFEAADIKRGGELAAIGNCASCHTETGGQVLAGGRAFKTAFGTLYAPNITPDPETGIGRWSEAAFQRAMREGVDRGGRQLYPAFPYDHFTLVTDEDNSALYAYLMTRPPVRFKPPKNELGFPYNMRLTAAAWKLLFFKSGPFQADKSKPESWNHGAYLAEGLAHCGACHTPRNELGAERPDSHFDGSDIGGWYAYAINAKSQAPTPWTVDALAAYLRRGWHRDHGMARGPMSPVVTNLSTVPEADIRAIAEYVGSMTTQAQGGRSAPVSSPQVRQAKLNSADSLASARKPDGKNADDPGAKIYSAACATCHQSGRPMPFGGIDLARSTAIHGASPRNLINVTLYGLPSTPGERSAIMPGFRASLTDSQIESLVNHLRQVSGKPAWTDVAKLIREARDTPPEFYPSPGTQGAPADPSQKGAAW